MDKLAEKGIQTLLPVDEDKVPLFVPIVLNNRDEVRKAMFRNEIFCPVHWPEDDMGMKRGKLMARTELSLIVDQRYGRKEMEEIITSVIRI